MYHILHTHETYELEPFLNKSVQNDMIVANDERRINGMHHRLA
jgi:hypothetical protein